MLNVIKLNVIMLNVIMLNAIMLNGIMLSVVAPQTVYISNWVSYLWQSLINLLTFFHSVPALGFEHLISGFTVKGSAMLAMTQ